MNYIYFDLCLLSNLIAREINENAAKTIRLNSTIVELTGTPSQTKDVTNPAVTQHTDTQTEVITTVWNRLQIRIEVRAGKIIIADIRSVPSILIPITIVTAVSREITVLYRFVRIPVAVENVSSKVIAKILL